MLFSSYSKDKCISAWDVRTDRPSKLSNIKLQARCHSFVARGQLLFCSILCRTLTVLEFWNCTELRCKTRLTSHEITPFYADKCIQATGNGRVVYINDKESRSLVGLSLAKLKTVPFLSQNLKDGYLQTVNYSCLSKFIFSHFGDSNFAVFSAHSSKVVFRKDSEICKIHSSQFLFKDKFLCLGYSTGALVILDLVNREMRYLLTNGFFKILTLTSLPKYKSNQELLFIGGQNKEKIYVYSLKSAQFPQLKFTQSDRQAISFV